MTLHNRSMRPILLSLIVLMAFQAFASSTPVYLQPNNPAPTGHFAQKLLKERALTYDEFKWLWVRDSQGRSGWVLESSVMLPLDFSRQAVLSKGETVYPEPKNYKLPQKKIERSQIVSLLQRKREWYKILYKQGNKKISGWIRSSYLRPYSKDSGYFYTTKDIPLRKKPIVKAKFLGTVSTGQPIIPIKILNSWAYVQAGKRKGYIPLSNLRSRVDIAMKVRTSEGYFKPHSSLIRKKVLEIFANPLWVGTGDYTVELKSKPDMGSNTVTTVSQWESLHLQGYSIKRWGKSHVPRWGELWWPEQTIESNIEIIESFKPNSRALSRSEVFQIEKSRMVPGLRFASTAHGIFRSFDGKLWHPLPDFKHGYPIKMTRNGALFVGDKVSFDHGESFQGYVRWDKVLSSIPNKNQFGHGPIQILNVEPNLKNHKRVTLSLKVGSNKIMQIYTPNLGKSWRLR